MKGSTIDCIKIGLSCSRKQIIRKVRAGWLQIVDQTDQYTASNTVTNLMETTKYLAMTLRTPNSKMTMGGEAEQSEPRSRLVDNIRKAVGRHEYQAAVCARVNHRLL